MPRAVDDNLLTRYLLGDLPEAEQTQVEELLFSDPACHDALRALKAELMDQYVRGSLPAAQRDAFARRFLTTGDGRRDWLFARALDAVLDEERPAIAAPAEAAPSWRDRIAQFLQPVSFWQTAMIAALLLLTVGGGYLLLETSRLRGQLDLAARQLDAAQSAETRLQDELRRAGARNQELDAGLRAAQEELDAARAEYNRLAASSGTGSLFGTFMSMVLVPGVGRGEERVDTLFLTPQTRTAQLQLLLAPGERAAGHRAETRTKQGELVHTQTRLRARQTKDGTVLLLDIPTQSLPDGQYQVSLFGVAPGKPPELINYYDFKIARRK
ncbi:MAG: hypothetical protein SF339_05760 [Blastocatellia bacterium]|nr:hypothetical protein [Blastocatellia bacterium]